MEGVNEMAVRKVPGLMGTAPNLHIEVAGGGGFKELSMSLPQVYHRIHHRFFKDLWRSLTMDSLKEGGASGAPRASPVLRSPS